MIEVDFGALGAHEPLYVNEFEFRYTTGRTPISSAQLFARADMRALVALVLAVCTITSPAADKKDVTHEAIKADAAASNQGAQAPTPITINVIGQTQALDHSCHPANCNREPDSWLDKLWSDPVATFTGFLFVATLGLIGTGLVQWNAMRDQERTTRVQTRAYLGRQPA